LIPNREALSGISAVLQPGDDLDSTILDLAAVLEGLVSDRFEIIVVTTGIPAAVLELRTRVPRLPLRVVEGSSIADGCDSATYELIFVAAGDGEFDVRELNHLMDAIEHGADVAAGYRPRRMESLIRRFQRWGWKVDVDCAYELLRRGVWQAIQRGPHGAWGCAELLSSVRRLGYQVAEVPVSHKRPATMAVTLSTGSRAA
jgi:hypothetical protein